MTDIRVGNVEGGFVNVGGTQIFRGNVTYTIIQNYGNDDTPSLSTPARKIKGSPYLGLRPFTETDGDLYFGRQEEIIQLSQKMQRSRFVAVVGASGSGKSSLVAAGLIPKRQEEARVDERPLVYMRFTPSANPFQSIAEALLVVENPEFEDLNHDIDVILKLANDIQTTPQILIDRLGALVPTENAKRTEILLFIDQFEELFTLTPQKLRGSFADLVSSLAASLLNIRIIITLRHEYVPQVVDLNETLKILTDKNNTVEFVGPPSRDALRDMIEEPIKLVDGRYADGVVKKILDDLANRPGNLALLEFLLDRLYRFGGDDKIITLDEYNRFGGVNGAITEEANRAFKQLRDSNENVTEETLHTLFERLVKRDNGQFVRQVMNVEDADGKHSDPEKALISALVEARLLVKKRNAVEVAHEALFANWDLVRAYLDKQEDYFERREELVDVALAWKESGRLNERLYTGKLLQQALEFKKLYPEFERKENGELVFEFIDTSEKIEIESIQRLEAAQKRSRNARRTAILVGMVAAVVAIGALVISTNAREAANMANAEVAIANDTLTPVAPTLTQAAEDVNNAQEQGTQIAIEADDTRREADSILLAAKAQDIASNGNPSLGLSLVLEAINIAESPRPEFILSQLISLPGAVQHFRGHAEAVYAVAYSPNNETVLSGSVDGTIALWDVNTGEVLHRYEGHTETIWSVAFSPNGERLISGSADDTLILWDVATGEIIHQYNEFTDVVSVAFSPDGQTIVSGSLDGAVNIWNANSGEHLGARYTEEAVNSVTFSPDGQTLLSGSSDGTLTLWDAESWVVLQSYEGHVDSVNSVAFNSDGQTLLSGSFDGTLILWDTWTGTLIRQYQRHTREVSSVAFSSDGQRVISGSWDNSLILWDTQTGSILAQLEGHKWSVQSVTFSSDGQRVISGSWDNSLILWDLTGWGILSRYDGHQGSVTDIAFDPLGDTFVSSSLDGTVILWGIDNNELLKLYRSPTDFMSSVTYSPDGQRVLSGSSDGTLILWDVATGEILRLYEKHTAPVWDVVYSPDGQRVLSGSSDGTLILWDVATGEILRLYENSAHEIYAVAFAPDGQSALSASDDQTLILWDVASGEVLRRFEGHSDAVLSVAFAPDGQSALSASDDQTLILWDVASGEVLRRFEGHSGSVLSVAFAPDGQSALSASDDGTLILWRIDDAAQLQQWVRDNRYIPELTCEQRGTYGLEPCVNGTPPPSPTFVPTRTPFPTPTIPVWTPIASPTITNTPSSTFTPVSATPTPSD